MLSGRSRFTAGDAQRAVEPGDVIYVATGVNHGFHDTTEQLQLIVVFVPPETDPP